MKEPQIILLEKFFQTTIEKLEQAKRFSTARNYRKTMESFLKFVGKKRLLVSDLTPEIIAAYDEYLSGRGATRNTLSFYNRILRALYNKAVSDGYEPSENRDPFERVYTGVDRTIKRSLGTDVLRRIIDLDLSDSPELDLSRDLFLFSFYARGMCFVDMAKLCWDDISNDRIVYVRSKTDQRLIVRIEPCMAAIMEKWKPIATQNHVFPIVRSVEAKAAFEEYVYRLSRHNLMLKEIGRRVNVPFPLNSYAARHSWATLARDSGTPLSVISSGMGHTTERTTRIYLSELDNGVIDRANQRIIAQILGGV